MYTSIVKKISLILLILILFATGSVFAAKANSGDSGNDGTTSSGGYLLSTPSHVNIRGGTSKNVILKAIGTPIKYGSSAELSFSGSSITAAKVSATTSASIAIGIKQSPGLVRSISVTIYPEGAEMPAGNDAPSTPPPPYIIMKPTTVQVHEGELSGSIQGVLKNATGSLSWSIGDSSVATIKTSGGTTKIQGIKEGTTTLTCRLNNYKGDPVKATCNVKVLKKEEQEEEIVEVQNVSLPTYKDMIIGSSATIVATVSPSNATDKTVEWRSSDSSKVSVNGNGQLQAKALTGSSPVGISAIASNGKMATCYVFVRDEINAVEDIDMVTISGPVLLETGRVESYKATVLPTTAKDRSVTWSISPTEVARISSWTGLATGVKPGIATITATSKADANKYGVYQIKVEDRGTNFKFSPDILRANYEGESETRFSNWSLKDDSGKTIDKSNFRYSISGTDRSSIFISGGDIVAKDAGTVTITATPKSGSKYTGSATMQVVVSSAIQFEVQNKSANIEVADLDLCKDKYAERNASFDLNIINPKNYNRLPLSDFNIESSNSAIKYDGSIISIGPSVKYSTDVTFTITPKEKNKYKTKSQTLKIKVNVNDNPYFVLNRNGSLYPDGIIDFTEYDENHKSEGIISGALFSITDQYGNKLDETKFSFKTDNSRVSISSSGTVSINLKGLEGAETVVITATHKNRSNSIVYYLKNNAGGITFKMFNTGLVDLGGEMTYQSARDLAYGNEWGIIDVLTNTQLPMSDFNISVNGNGIASLNGQYIRVNKTFRGSKEITITARPKKPEIYDNKSASTTITVNNFVDKHDKVKTDTICCLDQINLGSSYDWEINSGGGSISNNVYTPPSTGESFYTVVIYGYDLKNGAVLKYIYTLIIYYPTSRGTIEKKVNEVFSISEGLYGVPNDKFGKWKMRISDYNNTVVSSVKIKNSLKNATVEFYYNNKSTGITASLNVTSDTTWTASHVLWCGVNNEKLSSFHFTPSGIPYDYTDMYLGGTSISPSTGIVGYNRLTDTFGTGTTFSAISPGEAIISADFNSSSERGSGVAAQLRIVVKELVVHGNKTVGVGDTVSLSSLVQNTDGLVALESSDLIPQFTNGSARFDEPGTYTYNITVKQGGSYIDTGKTVSVTVYLLNEEELDMEELMPDPVQVDSQSTVELDEEELSIEDLIG